MADFKDRYDHRSLYKLALRIKDVYDAFPVEDFCHATLDKTWDRLEFKQRVMRISATLGTYLPADYKTAIRIIDQVIAQYDVSKDGFVYFFPGFVELYGQGKEDREVSMAALARYTRYASAEFAVRAFIINDQEHTMKQMYAWTKDDDEHVRRLASEGCRPRLPWGQALPAFQKDPSPVLEILEQLKADPSPYVRKSVANNLNDISKTHPSLVAKIAADWYGKNKYTDQIVKHGCRTLLKKGDRDVLDLFGFGDADQVEVDGFSISSASVAVGETIAFSFTIAAKKETKVRIDYAIDYVKANGRSSRKIFRISELTFKKDGTRAYTKTHFFADTSTRKHYPGTHSIALVVNGTQRATGDLEVLVAR